MLISMWTDTRVVALEAKVAALELALEREKSARLADRLEVAGKMETIREDLAGMLAGLRRSPADGGKAVRVFRNARDFAAAVEKEEGVNAA